MESKRRERTWKEWNRSMSRKEGGSRKENEEGDSQEEEKEERRGGGGRKRGRREGGERGKGKRKERRGGKAGERGERGEGRKDQSFCHIHTAHAQNSALHMAIQGIDEHTLKPKHQRLQTQITQWDRPKGQVSVIEGGQGGNSMAVRQGNPR